MKRILFAFFIPLLFATTVVAEPISFEATINRSKIPLGSKLQLTLTVKGVEKLNAVELPEIDGFKSQYLGPSTQIIVVNGKYSKTTSFVYLLSASVEGKYMIPSFSIAFEGKTYSTNPIEVEVVPASTIVQQKTQSGETETVNLEDRVFLAVEVPKKEVYLHEQIPVSIKLYIQELPVSDIEYPVLANVGFISDDFQKPKQYTEVIGGLKFNVVEFNLDIYPTRTGELTLGPAQIKANILHRVRNRSSSSIIADEFFGKDVFASLLDRVQKQPISIKSYDTTIKVLPLPDKDKPADFSGGVGEFQFESSAGPQSVKVGDPITVRMKVSGSGDLRPIQMPLYKDDENFKTYDPQIKDQNGERVLEQVLIPRHTQVKEVPFVEFNYFDPTKKQYQKITKGPFPVTVQPSQDQGDFKVIELSRGEQVVMPEIEAKDLVYIKNDPGKFRAIGYHFGKSKIFKALLVIFTIIYVGLYLLYLQLVRMKSDKAYARRLQAPRGAKKGLQKAWQFIEQDRYKEFYDCLFKTIQDYFGNKFHLASKGITYNELEKVLLNKKIDGSKLTKLRKLFDECDGIRFGAIPEDSKQAQQSLRDCEELIDYFERKVR